MLFPLLLLGEDCLELLNGAFVLFSQLLKLRAMLLLFLLLSCLFILLILTHKLGHQLIRLFCRVIEVSLAVFKDLNCALVLQLAHNTERSVTGIVACKDIKTSILYNVLEQIRVLGGAVFRGQMQDVVAR